jgi:hypothetical protein
MSSKHVLFALVMVVCASVPAVAATATTANARNAGQALSTVSAWRVTCALLPGSGEFANDLRLHNLGPGRLPRGARVRWQVGTSSGTHTFAQGLRARGTVDLHNVLPSGAPPAAGCDIAALPPTYAALPGTRNIGAAPWNLTCRVPLGPGNAAASRDIMLTNRGPGTVPAGTKLAWRVADVGGEFSPLPWPIPRGTSLRAQNVIPGFAYSTDSCTVTERE